MPSKLPPAKKGAVKTPAATATKAAAKKTTSTPSVRASSKSEKEPAAPKELKVVRPQRISDMTVISIAKELEGLLEKYHGGQGRSLRDKYLSSTIPQSLHGGLAMINAMRNKASHEASFLPSRDLPENFFHIAVEVQHFLKTGQLVRAI